MLAPDALAAAVAQRSLVAYAQRVLPAWQPARHLIYIANLLEQLEAGKIRRLVISVPVRHGKSVLCSQILPSWFLGRHPTEPVIISSHSLDLAQLHSRNAKLAVESPRYPFPNARMSADSTSVARWNLTAGGGCYAVGTGGSISGRGAALLIADDPLHDAHSQTAKDEAWAWWQEIAVPRLNPGGKVLIVSARLAPDDLVGRILESEDGSSYTYVRLPAIAEEGDPLGREPGEALWPEMIPLSEINNRRSAMTQNAFAAQLQQEALPSSGRIFDMAWFPEYDRIPSVPIQAWNPLDIWYQSPLSDAQKHRKDFMTVTAVDAAAKATDSGSYSAIATVVSDGSDIYVAEVERGRWDFAPLRERVIAHCERWQSDAVVIEEAAFGSRLLGDLRATTHLSVIAADPFKRGKEERALKIVPMCEAGRVRLPQRALWKEDFVRELAGFPGRFTDQTDAFVWALMYVHKLQYVRRDAEAFDRQMEGFSLFG